MPMMLPNKAMELKIFPKDCFNKSLEHYSLSCWRKFSPLSGATIIGPVSLIECVAISPPGSLREEHFFKKYS